MRARASVCACRRAFAFRTFLSNYVITHVPPFSHLSTSRSLQSVLPPYHAGRPSTRSQNELVDGLSGYHVVTRPRIEFHANDYKVPAICGRIRDVQDEKRTLLRYYSFEKKTRKLRGALGPRGMRIIRTLNSVHWIASNDKMREVTGPRAPQRLAFSSTIDFIRKSKR